jgi:hypothetical protein
MFGLPGAALAWVIRVSLDAALLFGATGLGWQAARLSAPCGAVVLVALAVAHLNPLPLTCWLASLVVAAVAGGILLVQRRSTREPLYVQPMPR